MEINSMDYDILVDAKGVEVECSESLCTYSAADEGTYESPLCPVHMRERHQWDEADNERSTRGEYGQFETDRSTG